MAILIKRYANRKLYNTETSRYITLKGIAKLLDEGEEVRVVDKETGEDITQVALSQILVDNQRAKESPSDTLLTQILSKGGDALYGALKKGVDDATDNIGEFQDRVREFVNQAEEAGLRARGFGSRSGGDADERAGSDTHESRSPFTTGGSSGRRDDEDTGESDSGRPRALRGFGDFREAIQSAVGNALDLREFGEFPRKRDFDDLNRNLTRVAEAMERLEALLREREEQ